MGKLEDDIYLKRSKTKGIIYYKIFRRKRKGKDEYLKMAGTAKAIFEKLVLMEKLMITDQQKQRVIDQLVKTMDQSKKDQYDNIMRKSGLSDDDTKQ